MKERIGLHSLGRFQHALRFRNSRLRSALGIAFAAFTASGCLSEQSYPMQSQDVQHIHPMEPAPGRYRTTREWLVAAEKQLEPLLPLSLAKPMLTDDLVDQSGKPVDVFRHFGINPASLQVLAANYPGIAYTARLVAMTSNIDTPAAAWPGFDDVWIPVAPEVSLYGRLGFAKKNGAVRDAPCIVLLPGFYGDVGVQRTRDLAAGLIDSGYHVLAVDLRGHGQTEAKYPNVAYQFGVRESSDLLVVAEWLQAKPHVISTGLIGFCWGGHTALLTAWQDGRCGIDPAVSPLLSPHLPKPNAAHHYNAGILSFSPSLKYDEILDWLDSDQSPLVHPIYAGLQDTVRSRKTRKGMSPQNGNLRELIASEFKRTELSTPRHLEDIFNMLRFMPYKQKACVEKLHRARMPVLIVQAADDPMIPAQWMADFVAFTDNKDVATLILPSGGHVGFAAWARQYYFSLIVNFFDPARGAAAATCARYEVREFGPNDPRPRITPCPPPNQRPSVSWVAPTQPADSLGAGATRFDGIIAASRSASSPGRGNKY